MAQLSLRQTSLGMLNHPEPTEQWRLPNSTRRPLTYTIPNLVALTLVPRFPIDPQQIIEAKPHDCFFFFFWFSNQSTIRTTRITTQ